MGLRYVAFEGVDHAGKTAQSGLLTEWLNRRGRSTVQKKCGGLGGTTRWLQALREKAGRGYQTAEAQMRQFEACALLQNRELNRTLRRTDQLVVGDKSVWSYRVWEEVNGICRLSARPELVNPDLVIFLDVAAEVAHQRIMANPRASLNDRVHTLDSLQRFVDRYRYLSRTEPGWVRIDGDQSIERVTESVVAACLESAVL